MQNRHKIEEVLCIIPARGGSKGIRRKNIVHVGGKPLIAWAIENALNADCINRVVVSTNDDEISKTSIKYKAEVVRRPDDISEDNSPSELALLHTLNYLFNNEGYKPDWIVFLQCTSPLLLPQDIDNAYRIAVQDKLESVFSVFKQHFVGRWQIDADGMLSAINYDPNQRPMRQNSKNEYIENGALYILRPNSLYKKGIRFGEPCGIYIMAENRSFQVDTIEDLKIIEKLLPNEKPL